jgi:hydroxyversicolorone monooxygenase
MGATVNGSHGGSSFSEALDYEVPMTILHDSKNRPLKVIAIGAGMSGIMSIYKIQKECQSVELVVYDKNPSVGGTWFENRYPGFARLPYGEIVPALT